jgi:hypothetical protein
MAAFCGPAFADPNFCPPATPPAIAIEQSVTPDGRFPSIGCDGVG